MPTGELLTRWTVRLALALYFAALMLRLTAAGRPSRLNLARHSWTAGCIAFLIHIACAFHFYHHWSHAAAHAETARQTAEVVGWDWGGGLYADYLFALVLLADVIWWWMNAESYLNRPRWIEWSVHGFMAFIAFNATVVFGHGAIRCLGAAAFVCVLGVAWRVRHTRQTVH